MYFKERPSMLKIISVLTLICVVGCQSPDVTPEENLSSAVMVYSYDVQSSGTGAVVDIEDPDLPNKTWILTSLHVLEKDDKKVWISVQHNDRSYSYSGTVQHTWEDEDMVLISIDLPRLAHKPEHKASLNNKTRPDLLDEVYFSLWMRGHLKIVYPSQFSGIVYSDKTVPHYVTSDAVNFGASGGLVFNKDGTFVGMCIAIDPGFITIVLPNYIIVENLEEKGLLVN